MDPLTTSAIITGGVGVGQAIGGAIGGSNRNKKNREFAREQEESRRKWDLENWHRQNAYNHPTEQLNRMNDAGLNPNLVYGKGAGSVGGDSTSSVGQSTGAAVDHENIMDGMSRMQNPMQQAANFDNTASQTNATKAQAMLTGIKGIKEFAGAAKTWADKKTVDALRGAQLKNLEAQTRKTNIDSVLGAIGISYMPQEKQMYLAKTATEIANNLKNMELTGKKITEQQIQNEILKIQKQSWEDGINPQSMPYGELLEGIIDMFTQDGDPKKGQIMQGLDKVTTGAKSWWENFNYEYSVDKDGNRISKNRKSK